MKKILHIFPSFIFGGSQKRLKIILENDKIHLHFVFSINGDYSGKSNFKHLENVIFLTNINKQFNNNFILINIVSFLRNSFYHLICTYNFGSILFAFINGFILRKPHIHFEDGFGKDEVVNTKIRRNIFRRIIFSLSFIELVVVSDTLKVLAQKKWYRGKRLNLINNGIEIDSIENTKKSKKDNNNLIKLIVFTRLSPEKNLSQLITLIERCQKKEQLQLTIYGDGECRNSLKQQISNLNLQDIICLKPFVCDVNKYLCKSDIFILTSLTEQMPFAILEAMKCSLLIMATDVGDIKKMVSPENRDFLLPIELVEMSQKFNRSIDLFINNKLSIEKIGQANNIHLRKNYNKNKMLNKYNNLYVKLLSC